MKKILILIVFISIQSFGQIPVLNTSFFSTSLDTIKDIQIILPPGYNEQDTVTYPVVYFLHGMFSNQSGYPQVNSVLNTLYNNNLISEFILVKPDGSSNPYYGSFYSNSLLNGNYEDYIVDDVINYVESTHKVKPGRENRFIMGHSMGGFGAMKIALKYPEKFRGVAAHSGPLDFNNFDAQLPYILQENGGSPPYIYHPNSGVFSILFFAMAGAFSPNLSNNYSVDIPLDENGVFINSIMEKWMEHNPSGLINSLINYTPAIYFDCGTLDELQLFIHNTGFRDTLDITGIPYTFRPYTGFHGNKLNERLEISLLFIDSVYRSVPTSVGDIVLAPAGYRIYQNYPNPFNPTTEISISIPEEADILLKVYDILGNEIITLADENKSAGVYRYSFNGSSLSNGVYFCRMEAGGYNSVIKMILLK
jgi:S-formylglutathione hydrolase FrmB